MTDEHWNENPPFDSRDRNTGQSGWRQIPAPFCFFPHRVFAHPLWTARQQPQFTAHRDKQGRQEEECAWIEQGCTKSSGDEHLHRPTTRDLPPRCHAKNKFTPSHTSRRPQLTRWRLREDCERLTSNWLHGERVLARGGHRLIFYPLNLSQLLVQGERHLGRTASSDYPLSLRSFIWVCTDTSSMRLFKRLSGNFHHSPLVFLDFLSLKIKITKLDFTDWQNNVVIIQNALVMMHNHCPLPVDTYQAPWLSMRTHTFQFFSYKVTMIFAGWFLPAYPLPVTSHTCRFGVSRPRLSQSPLPIVVRDIWAPMRGDMGILTRAVFTLPPHSYINQILLSKET